MAKKLYFGIVLVLVIILNNSSAYKCKQFDSCICEFDDYTQINLNPLLASNTFINDTQGNYTYYFSGCRDVEFKAQYYHLNSTQHYNASLIKCIEQIIPWNITTIDPTTNNTILINATYMVHNCSPIGLSNQIKYDNTYGDQIVYEVKQGSYPSIQLVCDTYNQTDLKIKNYESNELTLYSPLVCLKHLPHHELSTGSIFCILFFTAAIIYFVGGGLIMYTARGARGVEVIPNYDFWASLPGLMRDGMVYILSGCRPFTVATAETYDRI